MIHWSGFVLRLVTSSWSLFKWSVIFVAFSTSSWFELRSSVTAALSPSTSSPSLSIALLHTLMERAR